MFFFLYNQLVLYSASLPVFVSFIHYFSSWYVLHVIPMGKIESEIESVCEIEGEITGECP